MVVVRRRCAIDSCRSYSSPTLSLLPLPPPFNHSYAASASQAIIKLWNRHGKEWCNMRFRSLTFVEIPETRERPLKPIVPLSELRELAEKVEREVSSHSRSSKRRKFDAHPTLGKRNREENEFDENESDPTEGRSEVTDHGDQWCNESSGDGEKEREQGAADEHSHQPSPPKKRIRANGTLDNADAQFLEACQGLTSPPLPSDPSEHQWLTISEPPACAPGEADSAKGLIASLKVCEQALLESTQYAERLLLDKDDRIERQRRELSELRDSTKSMSCTLSMIERERDELRVREAALISGVDEAEERFRVQRNEDASRHRERVSELEKRLTNEIDQRFEAHKVEREQVVRKLEVQYEQAIRELKDKHEREVQQLGSELARARAEVDKERDARLEISRAVLALQVSVRDASAGRKDVHEGARGIFE